MKITPRFIQRSCIEGDKIDLRQANAVLKYKPDIILFELPLGRLGPNTIFNNYPVNKKPLKKVTEIIKNLRIMSKKYPYAKSDITVWKNIKKLWAQGHNVYIYNIDTPSELRKKYFKNFKSKYSEAHKDWLFWIYLYIREMYMKKNIQYILKNYKEKRNPTIAVFVQLIHWKHIQFLLKNPDKPKIWKYYFGKFSNLKIKTIDYEIKNRSLSLDHWWKKIKFYDPSKIKY
ncbi:MAG: hypothetical protein COX02_02035 [Candidatus Vogelbacteria bacterium CG22_combo_CG10-13_8_21_14_all_37_9]|uniref:Uncharacterized protein n=1 Tax=Candidatus Vogelbacteria bacterium CG22_combo_CG10-13_8_21_14_all_37_9 TaxID=1975046 RepID=A0A2H0BKD9_9BACT|nr:MAG: hypothetical protein COX02_02035 [Candidatus Vogelbacteria bacterium CG22_combo_CG10-13_8_21_14_all_37_9]